MVLLYAVVSMRNDKVWKFYKINSGTWQSEVDEFCLSSNLEMMRQIKVREAGFLVPFKLEEQEWES